MFFEIGEPASEIRRMICGSLLHIIEKGVDAQISFAGNFRMTHGKIFIPDRQSVHFRLLSISISIASARTAAAGFVIRIRTV